MLTRVHGKSPHNNATDFYLLDALTVKQIKGKTSAVHSTVRYFVVVLGVLSVLLNEL